MKKVLGFGRKSQTARIRPLDAGIEFSKRAFMKIALPLKEMTVSEKIGIMEEIWTDLSSVNTGYSPPDWHERILEERTRLAGSGEVGFTDWETAKREIRDRVS
jgi:hypothetical protein